MLTEQTVDDRKRVEEHINNCPIELGRFIADGGFYSQSIGNKLNAQGIVPVIPPPRTSVIHGKEETKWHDQLVEYIKEKGIYAFYKKYDYGLRNLVEAQFSRIKRCLGEKLQTLHPESQKREAITLANIINFWNGLGKPISVKVS